MSGRNSNLEINLQVATFKRSDQNAANYQGVPPTTNFTHNMRVNCTMPSLSQVLNSNTVFPLEG